MEAKQKVLITSKDGQTATGDWAIFDTKANTVLLGDDVTSRAARTWPRDRGSRSISPPACTASSWSRSPPWRQPAPPPAPRRRSRPRAASRATRPERACPPGKQCLLVYPKEAKEKAKSAVEKVLPEASAAKTGEAGSRAPAPARRSGATDAMRLFPFKAKKRDAAAGGAADGRAAATGTRRGRADRESSEPYGGRRAGSPSSTCKKSYRNRMVVKGVSLETGRGEAVGLLGPNGAGKTTVFYMVTGLVPADAGQVTLDGRDVTRLPMYRRARLGIGYLPQEASIFRGLTVEQNIMAVLELVEPKRKRRKEQLDSLLEEFNITRLRKSPSLALSGGERRRCEIARALASRPSFMLLDEPFAGIDPLAVGDIQQLVRQLTARGIGVLITDHNVRETLSLVDRAYIIYDGQVLTHGNPREIIANEDVRRVYLGDMFD